MRRATGTKRRKTEVGEAGKQADGEGDKKKATGGKKRKVKVGRSLGVGDLVERSEVSQKD